MKEAKENEEKTVDRAGIGVVDCIALLRRGDGGCERHLRRESDLDADFLHRQAGHFRLRGNDGLFQR